MHPALKSMQMRKFSVTLLVYAVIVSLWSGTGTGTVRAAEPPGIAVANAGFESGDLTGWVSLADPSKGQTAEAVSADTAPPHEGSYSAKVGGSWTYLVQGIDLQPLSTYELSGWGRLAQGTAGYLTVKMVDGHDVAYTAPGAAFTGREYERKSLVFTTPASIKYVQIFLHTTQENAVFYADDIAVVPAEVPAPTIPTPPDKPFRVEGVNILDPNGNPFVGRGVNVNGPNWVWPRETSQDAGLIVDKWKFNAVRVNAMVGGGDGRWTTNNDTDRIVNAFTSKGAVVMFAVHDINGNYYSDTSNPTLGQLVDWWKAMAVKYKNNPYVWFNIANELGWDQVDPQWLSNYKTVVEAIRSTGAQNIIVIDGATWGQDAGKSGSGDVQVSDSAILSMGEELKASDPTGNLAFSIHLYGYMDYDNGKLDRFVEQVRAKGLCLMLGEYGSKKDGSYLISTKNGMRISDRLGLTKFVWHWDGGDDWELTTADWTGGGGWGSDRTDGTKPGNLTWLGEKVWNNNHGIAMTYADTNAAVTDLIADRHSFEAGDSVRFQATLMNRGDMPIDGTIKVDFYADGVKVSSKTFEGQLPVYKFAVLSSDPVTVSSNIVEVRAEIDAGGSAYGEDVDGSDNGTDRTFNGTFNGTGADLAVTGVSLSKENPDFGDQVSLYAEVVNRGTTALVGRTIAGSFYVNGVKTDWDREAVDLAPGQSVVLQSQGKYRTTGDFELSFKLDEELAAVESDPADNAVFGAFRVNAASAYANLLANPGFEAGDTGWEYWGRQIAAEHAHTGDRAVKIGTAGGAGGQFVTLEPNTTYILGAWGKHVMQPGAASPGAEAELGFQYRPAAGADQVKHILYFDSTEYDYQQVMFTTPATLTDANVFVYKPGSNSEFFADDFVLAKVPNVLTDPGFEAGGWDWASWGRQIADDHAHTGSKAVKIGTAGGAGGQFVTLEPNTTYILGAWGKHVLQPGETSPSAAGDIGFQYRPSEGAEQVKHILSFSKTDYEYQQVMFTTPATLTDANVFVYKPGSNSEFFADDFVLAKVPNVLTDPGFEAGGGDWVNWGRQIAGDNAHTGGKAVKIGTAGGAGGQFVTLEPNTTYILGAWGKHVMQPGETSPSAKAELGFQYRPAAGADQVKHILYFDSIAYDYQQVMFTTPAALTDANVFVYKPGSNSEFYADDFVLTRVPNLASNPLPAAPGAQDTEPPAAVEGLNAVSRNGSAILLAWQPSTDNVGVAGYEIYMDGQLLDTVAGTGYLAAGLPAETSYRFSVKARDAAGNVSTDSAPLDAATTAAGYRILPLGDSITAGYHSTDAGGYRLPLWNKLFVEDGVNIDFVGSERMGPYNALDLEHEGHGGWRIADLAEHVDGIIALHRPDMILLQIGTNDMQEPDVSVLADRMGGLIDRIGAAAPDAELIVAQIPPQAGEETNKKIEAFNAGIRSLVADRAAAGRRIGTVDMYASLTQADLHDGIHPNDSGYAAMADAWYAGIVGVLQKPGADQQPVAEEQLATPSQGQVAVALMAGKEEALLPADAGALLGSAKLVLTTADGVRLTVDPALLTRAAESLSPSEKGRSRLVVGLRTEAAPAGSGGVLEPVGSAVRIDIYVRKLNGERVRPAEGYSGQAELSFPYRGENVKKDRLSVYGFDTASGQWAPMNGSLDKKAKHVSAELDEPGLYALLESPKRTG